MGSQGGKLWEEEGASEWKCCQTELRFGLWEPLGIRAIELHRLVEVFRQNHTTKWPHGDYSRQPVNLDVEAQPPVRSERRLMWNRHFHLLLPKKNDSTYLSGLVPVVSGLGWDHQTWPVPPGRRPEVRAVGTHSCLCRHSGRIQANTKHQHFIRDRQKYLMVYLHKALIGDRNTA